MLSALSGCARFLLRLLPSEPLGNAHGSQEAFGLDEGRFANLDEVT